MYTRAVLTDGFWKEKTELVTQQVLPYQWEALNDKIPDAPKSYCMRNFRLASEVNKRRKLGEKTPVFAVDKWEYTPDNSDERAFKGWVFQDSDFSKWIEAVGYSLMHHPDKELEKIADSAIDIVCSAQLENGYLDTLYIINNPEMIFTNLKDYHELYCFGHLCEGAISYYRATGKDKLLLAACRFADLICDTFGENGKRGYPGHEIAEMALAELYELTGKKKYLELAAFFINERGTKPYYFDLERNTVSDGRDYVYNQAHLPVREQTKAVGHAVRAVYLYSGMADVARLCDDRELFTACKRLFNNITQQKMYITAGIGSTADGEAFSSDYYLPPDTAYAESCASIGLAFFSYRMSLCEHNSVYADVFERALYNGILSGISLDGKSFFYVNPLEVNPDECESNSKLRHVKAQRQKWFGCACCPPNIARLITGIDRYCVSECDGVCYIDQYISGIFSTENNKITINSGFPYDGNISVENSTQNSVSVALRIPEWAEKHSFSHVPQRTEKGYAYFTLGAGECINACFNMQAHLVKSDPRVLSNTGKAALVRGPLVFCLEQCDNGKDLQQIYISKDAKFIYDDGEITADGYKVHIADRTLYSPLCDETYDEIKLKFIPYYKWANREKGEMTVFVKVKN